MYLHLHVFAVIADGGVDVVMLGSHIRNHIFGGSGPVLTNDPQQRGQQIIHQSKSISKMPSCRAHLLISAKAGRETPWEQTKGWREEGRIKRITTGHEASRLGKRPSILKHA